MPPARRPRTSPRPHFRRGWRPTTRSRLAAHRLDYDAIAETFALTDRKGAATATIFTVSYLVAPPPGATRPVSFVFNGGPGAASVFLHLGALGPEIMETPANGDAPSPPVRLVDNSSTWLPFTDLVFHRPGRHRFQPRRGNRQEPRQGVLGRACRSRLARRGHSAMADPARAMAVASLSGRRELWRISRRGDGGTLAARCRRDGQRARTDLAGARYVGAASERARPARRRLFPADLCRYRGGAARTGGRRRPRRRSSVLRYPIISSGWPGSRRSHLGRRPVHRQDRHAHRAFPQTSCAAIAARVPSHVFAREILRHKTRQ